MKNQSQVSKPVTRVFEMHKFQVSDVGHAVYIVQPPLQLQLITTSSNFSMVNKKLLTLLNY